MTDRRPIRQTALALRLRLARAALLWERVWPALLAGACASLGVFAVVALFDLLPGLPGLAHAAMLALFALAFAAAIGLGRARARRGGWPDRLAARRRIEQASGLPHRPLQALARPPERAARRHSGGAVGGASAADGGGGCAGCASAGRLPGSARRDPWGMRSVLAILLLLGRRRCRRRLARSHRPRASAEFRRRRRGAGGELRHRG